MIGSKLEIPDISVHFMQIRQLLGKHSNWLTHLASQVSARVEAWKLATVVLKHSTDIFVPTLWSLLLSHITTYSVWNYLKIVVTTTQKISFVTFSLLLFNHAPIDHSYLHTIKSSKCNRCQKKEIFSASSLLWFSLLLTACAYKAGDSDPTSFTTPSFFGCLPLCRHYWSAKLT